MSFKGIITKGEYDRGITLNAKVVAPNKKYSSRANFPVVIKANALSDKEKCLIALNEHKAAILSLGADLNDLTYDITDKLIESDSFGYKTSTSYSMSSSISPYISSTGVITKRPKYGSNDVHGTVAITTVLNETSITTHVPITLKSVTVQDILNDNRLSDVNLWERISGSQDKNNVYRNLNLVSSISLPDISDVPVSISWSVTDNASSIFNAYSDQDLGITQGSFSKRINDSTGAVTMIPYPVVYGCQSSLTLAEIPVTPNNSSSASSQIRSFAVGGLVLKAQISLEGSEEVVSRQFSLKVRSQLLTASDIFTALNATPNKIFQFDVVGTNTYSGKFPVNANTSPYNINIDSTMEQLLTFKVQANGENIRVERYGLPSVISLFHNSTPEILLGNASPSSSSQHYSDVHAGVFSNVNNDGAGMYMFTLDTSALKAIIEDGNTNAGKFTVAIEFGSTGYPVDGNNISASGGIGTQTGTTYICFNVDFTN